MRRPLFFGLVALAAFEMITLGTLLVNLMTVHQPVVARIVGPLHGAVYLTVVLIGLLSPGLRLTTRLLGIVPVLGGVLAALTIRRRL